jgi:predicted NBD/HSP70 family sugar kinase
MRSSFKHTLLTPNFSLGKGKKLFQDQERLIINLAFYHAASQREIVTKTKIPQQTISRLVKSLLDRNAICQTSKAPSGSRGQPGYYLHTNPDFAYGIGVAILLDGLSVAIMNFNGDVIATKSITLLDMTVKNVMNHLEIVVSDTIKQAEISENKILGIGVGISGYFTLADDKINTHNMLNDWADISIAQLLAEKFSMPVWVENDAKAAAAGEGIDGVGSEFHDFVYLFISTAFGGGVIQNGNILHGAHGNAGEVGDILPPKRYIHPNLENLRQILIKNGTKVDTISELLATFDINWPGINEWVNQVQDAVSLVASASAAILDTQAIVIGGHIPTELAELLIKNVEIYVQYRRSSHRPTPILLTAKSLHEPVAVGAASLPFRALCL